MFENFVYLTICMKRDRHQALSFYFMYKRVYK